MNLVKSKSLFLQFDMGIFLSIIFDIFFFMQTLEKLCILHLIYCAYILIPSFIGYLCYNFFKTFLIITKFLEIEFECAKIYVCINVKSIYLI